jgi:hypothetical protein
MGQYAHIFFVLSRRGHELNKHIPKNIERLDV